MLNNKLLSNVTNSTKLIILILLIMITVFAHSLYLLIFLTLLVIYLSIIEKATVKEYVSLIKNISYWLILLGVSYIIICRNILFLLLFIYKILLIVCLISLYLKKITFYKLNNSIYTLLTPLEKLKVNTQKISYNLTYFIMFIITWNKSKAVIKNIQLKSGYKSYNFKNYFLPRMFYSSNKLCEINNTLKVRYYQNHKENVNLESIILTMIFLLIFIIAIKKEVIL